VKQRRNDECLRACFATMLDLDYEECPDIDVEAVSANQFWAKWEGWFSERGQMFRIHGRDALPLPGEWIAVVPSLNQPGEKHAVLMRGATLIEDPSVREVYDYVTPSLVKYGITVEPT
jgi:hypothetical protein